MCGLEIENCKSSSLFKTEDSEGAIMTLQYTNASELATDESSAHLKWVVAQRGTK